MLKGEWHRDNSQRMRFKLRCEQFMRFSFAKALFYIADSQALLKASHYLDVLVIYPTYLSSKLICNYFNTLPKYWKCIYSNTLKVTVQSHTHWNLKVTVQRYVSFW